MDFRFCHSMPGRIRLSIPALGQNRKLGEICLGWLRAQDGIRTARINYDCASLVLEYDPAHEQRLLLLLNSFKRMSLADLKALGERQITLDCDVIQADGGTRTASITGAMVALVDALKVIKKRGGLKGGDPLKQMIAAVSVGMYQGEPVLDLDYLEDSAAETDLNVVMTSTGGFIEVQGTAEGAPFQPAELNAMLALAQKGMTEIFELQNAALAD